MNAVRALLRSTPYAQFRRHRRFYTLYDGAYLALLGALFALLERRGARPLLGAAFAPWHLALLPAAAAALVVAHALVHNAAHRNLPVGINRLAGELLGLLVLTRFASWEIIHRRHHRFSDDPARDPHPVIPQFWRYALRTLTSVETQLQRQYLETWGDTPANRRAERLRSLVSFGTGAALLAVFWRLLGTPGFVTVFLPAQAAAALFVVHFNWVTHNAASPAGDYRPVNLDAGWYWLGNRLIFGIYYHANHHARAGVFNPMRAAAPPPPREVAVAEARP